MYKFRLLLLLASPLFFACGSSAQDTAKPANTAAGALTGRWVVNANFFGSPIYFGLLLEQQGEKLTGNFDGDKLEGTASGGRVHFLAKDEHGGTEEGNATVSGGTMTGSVIFVDTSDPTHPETHSFTATRLAERREGAAKRHEFVPTSFYRRFSAENKPVLTVAPGDTIHTTTVDAGGTDEKA
jgi:amidase